MNRRRTRRHPSRRGAVAVEFALVAPVFVVILLGLVTVGRLCNVYTELHIAAREGARLAAMDREGIVPPGQTANQKVVQDIRNFMNVNGLPGDTATVLIADPDDRSVEFDLDDEDNNLKLFQIIIEVNYGDVATIAMPGMDDYVLTSRVVFRNGKAMIAQ